MIARVGTRGNPFAVRRAHRARDHRPSRTRTIARAGRGTIAGARLTSVSVPGHRQRFSVRGGEQPDARRVPPEPGRFVPCSVPRPRLDYR